MTRRRQKTHEDPASANCWIAFSYDMAWRGVTHKGPGERELDRIAANAREDVEDEPADVRTV